jgi:non-ribosomal peptide synthetase component F
MDEDISKTGDEVSELDWQKLAEWNDTPSELRSACIHDLFIDQAALQPNSLSISAWDGDLTYQELADLTERLAVFLSQKGILPEGRVICCFEKSMWAVVAYLGVLRAGGTYVPIDPEQPAERKAAILEDCNPRIALCSASSETTLPFTADLELFKVDEALLKSTIPFADERILEVALPSHAAVVLYTVSEPVVRCAGWLHLLITSAVRFHRQAQWRCH